MRSVRTKGTSPELLVRSLLHRLGYRFRTGNSELPGKPDIANRSRRWALFVHGCFWHAHDGCSRATIPQTNSEFWIRKLVVNKTRDLAAVRALRAMGYSVLVLWQCEISDEPHLIRQLVCFLKA